jgi:protein-L-isoaspartate O-methyltransferase
MSALVDEMVAAGHLRTPAWIDAFEAVPRAEFVPYFFRHAQGGWRMVEPPDPEWQESVGSGRVLVTQVGGSDACADLGRAGVVVAGDSTSSSSEVPLMADMLEALDVAPASRILEIGTGTGYNAALMAHAGHTVTSVDVDGALVERARERLDRLDLPARLVVGDGLLGHAGDAPYDRVIATVACPGVPRAWVEQCAPGAKILLPLTVGALVPLLTVADGTAHGRFLPLLGSFMPVRSVRGDAVAALRLAGDSADRGQRTALPVEEATSMMRPFEFVAALLTGGFMTVPSDGETVLVSGDGSWARYAPDGDGGRVRQGGPTPLWDRIEDAHRVWTDLGCPPRARFGLTVESGAAEGGSHTLWLDDPASEHRWPVALAAG